jgi:hypothetical protein
LNARTTIAPPTLAEAVIATPEFCDSKQLRLLFGLSRSHAYLLAQEGKIRSVSLRRPGSVRGKKLWDVTSVRRFLEANVEPAGNAKCAPGVELTPLLNKNAEAREDRRNEARSRTARADSSVR